MMTPGDPSNMPGDIVSPGDCALVVALPYSQSDLEHDLEEANKEFVRKIVLEQCQASAAQEAWDKGYRAFVDDVKRVVDEVRTLGVTAVENAPLSDVKRLFADLKVITFLAHGPFMLLRLDDRSRLDIVIQAVRQTAPGQKVHPVLELLRSDPGVRNAKSRNQMLRELNALIERTREFFHGVETESQNAKAGLTTLLLYEAFPDVFPCPQVIELRDGFHDFDAFCEIIPERYAGNLEFLVCSAVWFAGAIRRRRPRCGDILSPKKLVWARERIELYSTVIRLLRQMPMSYVNAYMLVHDAELV
jgi:hypothetical protein